VHHDIRHHPRLAGRAVFVGFAVLILLEPARRSAMRRFSAAGALWLNNHWVPADELQWLTWPLWYASLAAQAALSGWIVKRLHPTHRSAMVSLFAASFLVWQVVQPWTWTAGSTAMEWFRVEHYVLASIVMLLCILASGLSDHASRNHDHDEIRDQESP
jgi:hypothetical protein